MKLLYVMEDTGVCGGNRIIFEHAHRLGQRGHLVHCLSTIGKINQWFDPVAGGQKFNWVKDPEGEYDFVIATYWHTAYWVQRVKKRVRCKTIYYVQNREHLFAPLGSRKSYEAERTYRFDWDSVMFCAQHLRDWYKKDYSGVGNNNLYVFKNGIDIDRFKPQEPWPREKYVILVEGNMGIPWKNTELAMQAAREVTHSEIWHLAASNIGNSDATLLRKPPWQLLPSIYAQADVLVKCSYTEGDPLPVREAQCSGTPVVVNEFLGADECVNDNETGLIVRSNDHWKVAEAISLLIHHPRERARMQANCIAQRETFRWDPIIDKLEQYLLSL